ncbi:CAP domain-containing protein [uncultured Methylobacterium sp.]|uniref:CAP domain-containing protein n=1 Tax=uncultured Methylobacterium sp. TaxID=157278 RepID=UPI0035C9ED94
MHQRRASWTAALLLTLTGCYSGPALDVTVPTRGVILDEQAAATTISRYRAQHGLGPVVLDGRLTRAAAYQARANAGSGQLSHDVGGSFDERMTQTGFAKGYSAENLSAGSATFDEVFARWQASPHHNQNMLTPQFRRIGIARVDAPGSMYGRFWALELAD